MAEPTSAGAATLAIAAAAAPVLTAFGVPLGLRADLLLAGFGGAVAGIAFLNSVPSTGDTWQQLVRTSLRRVGFAVASALVAGYASPLVALVNGVPNSIMLSVSFVVGAGAPQMLPWLIERLKGGRKPDAAGDQA